MILVGDEEWDGLLDWLRQHALANHRIEPDDLAALHSVRTPAEVVRLVSAARTRREAHGRTQLRRGA